MRSGAVGPGISTISASDVTPGDARPGDVVGRYQAALEAGDAEAVVSTFAPDGYFRSPFGPHSTHRGTDKAPVVLHLVFQRRRRHHCVLTDDGVRCAVEYNCVRWAATTRRLRALFGRGIAALEVAPRGAIL